MEQVQATRGTAVVTGATRGIGRSVAASLGALGHPVYLCARDEEALTQTVKELQRERCDGRRNRAAT